MAYTLFVRFRSNEAPFSMEYNPAPYAPAIDKEAIEWACGMRETMGGGYDVDLLKDGERIEIGEQP